MSSSFKWKTGLVALALATSLGLAACGGGADPADGQASGGAAPADATLVTYAGSSTPIVGNFNPYAPSALPGTLGGIYEPLFFYNKAAATDPVPLLAEKAEWSEDGKTLTLKLRKGVVWNDGKDFTAKDVVYSFTNSAVKMDSLAGATASDDSTVELRFSEPAFTNEYSLLGATYMVPEHVFASLADILTFDNAKDPVGTGPFMLENVTDAAYTLKNNPGYWDPKRPGLTRIQYLGIDGNSSAESLFKAGQLDYSTFFVPKPDDLVKPLNLGYIKVASPNPTIMMTCSNADLGCTGPQTDVAVRQALNVAIDRGEINEKAYYGLANPASPTFVKPDRDEKWIAAGLPKVNEDKADPAKAKEILEAAGYTLGADGIYEKDGNRVSMKLESVEGWSDQNAAAELMVAQAKEAGIELQNGTITQDQYSEQRMSGKFQLLMGALFGTPISDPYTIYRNCFTSDYTKPVGTALEPTQTNYARYSNPEVDAAVAKAAKTNDEAEKKAAYAIVQQHIVEDVPYISMFHGGSQTFYNQENFTGWPTEDNLYAFPASWDGVSAAYILSNVTAK